MTSTSPPRRSWLQQTRRGLLRSLAVIGVGGGAMFLLRRQLLAPPPTVRVAGGGSSGWLPLAAPPGQLLLTIPVTVQGRPSVALIDSGAQLSAVDRGLVEALSLPAMPLPMVVFGLGGAPMLGRAASLDLMAGELSIGRLRAAELDLAGMGVPPDAAFSVIIGQNALKELVVDLDLPRRRVILWPAEGYAPPPEAVPVDTRLERGRLMATVRLAGVPLDVVVDTGATSVLALAEDVAERAGLLKGAVARRQSSVTLGGAQSGWEVRLPGLEFAGMRLKEVSVQIYNRSSGGPVASAILPSGLLGLGALSGTRAILALGQGRLYLFPP